MDPLGSRFAVGGTDSLISVWDLPNLTCLRSVERLDWPVRSLSVSSDGNLLAAGSEDHTIDIAWMGTGERVTSVGTDGETFSLAWHPTSPLLAYATAEPQSRSSRDPPALIKLFGLPHK